MGATSRHAWAALAVSAALLAGCSSDGSSSNASDTTAADDAASTTTAIEETTTTEAADETLVILVTNDDGIGADGIDAVTQALGQLDDTELLIYAPAEQQSGTGPKVTEGGASAAPGTTKSGLAGTAVNGFPADSVNYAFDIDKVDPHVIVSGINAGANLGAFVEVSGTVGAARAGVRRGIPALAVSMSVAEPMSWDAGVERVVKWITEHRDELLGGDAPVEVMNLNVPACTTGAVRGDVEVSTDYQNTDGGLMTPNCTAATDAGAADMGAFSVGYATWSVLSTEPTPNPFTEAMAAG